MSTLDIYRMNKVVFCYILHQQLFLISFFTCEHAFINNASAADQNCVTGHDGPIAGNDH